MSDSNALVRLPVAVFVLAFRKSMQTPRASYALHAAPKLPTYLYGSSFAIWCILVTRSRLHSTC